MIVINSPSVVTDDPSRAMVVDMRLAERFDMHVRVGNGPLVRQSGASADLIVPGTDAGVLGEPMEIRRHRSDAAMPSVFRTFIGGVGDGTR